jgi:hypothetical protein
VFFIPAFAISFSLFPSTERLNKCKNKIVWMLIIRDLFMNGERPDGWIRDSPKPVLDTSITLEWLPKRGYKPLLFYHEKIALHFITPRLTGRAGQSTPLAAVISFLSALSLILN